MKRDELDDLRFSRQRMIDSLELRHCSFDDLEPEPGADYVAFAVHSPDPNILLALAIAHRVGDMSVVDLVATGIRKEKADKLAQRFGAQITAGDRDAAFLNASMSAVYLLIEQTNIRTIQ
jgi:hypothetical protein